MGGEALAGSIFADSPRATKIGYEVSFARHFYKPQPLRPLEEISADILTIEKEAEELLDGLLTGGAS